MANRSASAVRKDAIKTFDVIVYALKQSLDDSRSYVEQEIEEHNRKFPKDRSSTFVRNLFRKVASDQDVYIMRLMQNLEFMKSAFISGNLDISSFKTNVYNGIASLGRILEKTTLGTDRYRHIEKAKLEYSELQRFVESFSTTPMSVQIPVDYIKAGWRGIGKDLWQKEQGIFILTVHLYDGKFYSTVKDVKNSRVYSNNTPFNTPVEAMKASVAKAVELVQTRTISERLEYKPKYIGGQGRLF